MASSRLDQIYRRLLLTKFFVKGWGKPENLHRIFSFRKNMANREQCGLLVDPMTPVNITKVKDVGQYMLYEGYFMSPFNLHLPGLMPEETKRANFQMILPHKWQQKEYRPICIHLAGTGDHGYWKRRAMLAKPLLHEHGIASILLENPFYGSRKPPEQVRSSLQNVSDLFVMGGGLILECMVLMHWCVRQRLGPVGLSGVSMGGHMASLASCSWPHPHPLIPCLSWTTASGVFTQGVLSGGINWEMLKNQYLSNQTFRDELFNLIHSPEGHFSVYHDVGQQFARDFPKSINHIEKIVTDDFTKSQPQDSSSARPLNSEAANANLSSASNTDAGTDNNKNNRNNKSSNESHLHRAEEESHLSPSNSRGLDGNSASVSDTKSNTGTSLNPSYGLTDDNNKGVNNSFNLANDNNTNNDNTSCDEAALPPPQFSHIDSQSNALNALDSPLIKNNKAPNTDGTKTEFNTESSDGKQMSCDTRGGGGIPTVINTTSSSLSFIGSYGLQSIKGVPVLLSSAVNSTSKVGKSIITSLNPFGNLGSFNNAERNTESRTRVDKDPQPTSPKKSKTRTTSKFLSLLLRYRSLRVTNGNTTTTTNTTTTATNSSNSADVRGSKSKNGKSDPHLGFTPVGVRPSNSKQTKPVQFLPYFTVKDPVTWEALQFMRGIMDECTHVGNFEMPVDPELVIIVQAIRDAYQPVDSMKPLNEVWPGSELRTIDTGHITAFILHHNVFRQAINDAFQRTYAKHRVTQNWTEGGKPSILPTEL